LNKSGAVENPAILAIINCWSGGKATGHFGPKTLQTLDTSALVWWVQTVRTHRRRCLCAWMVHGCLQVDWRWDGRLDRHQI